MSAPGRELSKPGNFETHRSQTGAATADNATVNDSNNLVSDGFFGAGCDSVWVYWTGAGGAGSDTMSIQPMFRDSRNGQWVRLAAVTFTKDVAQEVVIRGANLVYLRIASVTTTATDLKVRVAKASTEVPL